MAVVSDYTALLSGVSWTGGPVGQSVELTYSFSRAATASVLASSPAAAATFLALTEGEKATVRAALSQWSAVSGVTFHEVVSTPGDITFGMYDLSTIGEENEAGLGNYPSTGTYVDTGNKPQVYGNFLTEGGDVYFDRSYQTNPAFLGDFAHVAIHEIGHALGLKHPFEGPGNTLAASLDTGSQTVLAYSGVRSATLGPLDIGAVQSLYGTKSGALRPFVQVWHGDQEGLTSFGTGGAESLFGSGGNDVFYSNGGRDAIGGAEGDDIVYASGAPISVNGGPGSDTVVTGLTWGSGLEVGGAGSFRYIGLQGDFQRYIDVEFLDFTDGVYSTATNRFTAIQAGAYAWTGMTDLVWGTPGNWRATSGGAASVAPGAGDSVALTTGAVVSGAGSAASVALGGTPGFAGVFGFGVLQGGAARTTLVAGSRISASGGVSLAGGRFDVGVGASLEVGGSVLAGGGPGTVQVDAGAVFSGYGTVAAAGVVNNGTVAAAGGTLRFEGGASGVGLGSGVGRWTIAAGATLSVGALDGTYAFLGSGATLRTDTAVTSLLRRPVIEGFVRGDTLVIGGDPGVTRAVYQASGAGVGTLTVGAITLTLSGAYGQTRFVASTDGAGTVTVTAAALDPLFDDAYYLAHNPDVAAAGLDAWVHYTNWGFREGRNPNGLFDTSYYLTQNPDVRAAGLDPLAHFEANGWYEGREPSLLFSDAKYLAAYPDVRAAGLDPLAHYVLSGKTEGRMSFLTGGSAAADPLVDASFYDRQLGATLIPGGVAGAQQAAFSYDTTGWQRGLDPDAFFDTSYYLSHNPDVAAAHVNPLLHYEVFGWREGRDASAGFSTGKYLAAYGDVKAASFNPLLHYVVYGQGEGRTAFAV